MKRAKDGDVFRFPAEDGKYGYGQCIDIYLKIFDLFDDGSASVEQVLNTPVAFVTCLSKGTILDDRVERIGKSVLAPDAVTFLDNFYRYDEFTKRFQIVVPGKWPPLDATRADCTGLRLSSVGNLRSLSRQVREFRTGEVTMEGLLFGPLRKDFNIEKYYSKKPAAGVMHPTPSDYLGYEE